MADPWKSHRQSLGTFLGTAERRQARERQAPLDVAYLRKAEQDYDLGQIKMGETQRQLAEASDIRGKLANLPMTKDVGSIPGDAVGPMQQAPLSRVELASGRADVTT